MRSRDRYNSTHLVDAFQGSASDYLEPFPAKSPRFAPVSEGRRLTGRSDLRMVEKPGGLQLASSSLRKELIHPAKLILALNSSRRLADTHNSAEERQATPWCETRMLADGSVEKLPTVDRRAAQVDAAYS